MVRLSAVVLLASCTTIENADAVDPSTTLSADVFKCAAEVVLIKQCSYLGCHGRADAALRVYSVGKLRATTPKNADDASAVLTDAEHAANFRSAAAFSTLSSDPLENWLLRKPLPADLGGYAHAGGAIFTSTGDPNFMAIRNWLTAAIPPPGTPCK
ncbi:MAG: hypothetical protein NT062_12015 [Proteobacteria bacterium]|nr:hypothetical protein [Pseudomonadota bacterium]